MNSIALIVNRSCKNFNANKNDIDRFLNEIDCDPYIVEADQLDAAARSLEKYEIVVASGGDGTLNTVAQYIHSQQIFSVLPIGTLNHFVQDAGLPDNLEELICTIRQRKTKYVDILRVNDINVLNNISFGFYPKMVKKRESLEDVIGKTLSYIPAAIGQLFTKNTLKCLMEFDQEIKSCKLQALMISNNLYQYDFPTTLTRTHLDRGNLGLYWVNKSVSKSILQSDKNIWNTACLKKITLRFKDDKEIDVAVDGEVIQLRSPITAEIRAQALQVIG